MNTSTNKTSGPLETQIHVRYKYTSDALGNLKRAYRLIEAARERHEQGIDNTRARV